MSAIDFHSSARFDTLQRDVVESLRAGRLDPKALYLTPQQADLWREVSRKHAPKSPEFRRIYEDAFARVAGEDTRSDATTVELVGIGSGTGRKEAELCRRLIAQGRKVRFTGIDVSEPLVLEAAGLLVSAGAEHRRSLVCDLAEVDYLRGWLDEQIGSSPRLMTFFGLVPNFAPSRLVAILRALLGHGDVLLASVHLAPVAGEEKIDMENAMAALLPQYDNPETRSWLAAGIDAWEIRDRVTEPVMVIGTVEGIPAFLGQVRWKSPAAFSFRGETYSPDPARALALFQSLRYTSRTFDACMKAAAFRSERLSVTRCGEEGIWAIRPGL